MGLSTILQRVCTNESLSSFLLHLSFTLFPSLWISFLLSIPRTKQPLSKPITLHLTKLQLNIWVNRQGTAVEEQLNRAKGSVLGPKGLVWSVKDRPLDDANQQHSYILIHQVRILSLGGRGEKGPQPESLNDNIPKAGEIFFPHLCWFWLG